MARSGVPATTIHHYRRRGLLPPAHRTAPNRFLYDERHLRALQLVTLLRRRRNLPLEVIGEILPGLLADAEEAFRPEMWDEAILRARSAAPDNPAARLVEAATDAFARHGYAEVSVADVSTAAGLGKGTVYRHFASKEALFFAAVSALVARALAGFQRELAGSGRALPQDKAAHVLAVELGDRLPIVLELLTGALQRRSGYDRVARQLLGTFAAEVGARVAGQGEPVERGIRVLTVAAQHAIRSALDV